MKFFSNLLAVGLSPTQCPLCYWTRLLLALAAGVALGAHFGLPIIAIPIVLIVPLALIRLLVNVAGSPTAPD
jgi:hypothetical protein